ncbi:MAG TPA: hypothetical protein VGK99_20850 [Acidobacteriota bacterium]|jgi:hypothetical protein
MTDDLHIPHSEFRIPHLKPAFAPAVLLLFSFAWARWQPALLALPAQTLDLTHAVVVTPPGLKGPEEKSVSMLLEEVEKRTGVRWKRATTWPAGATPVVAINRPSAFRELAAKYPKEFVLAKASSPKEGYTLRTGRFKTGPAALVLGNDPRGMLFGVGRLLRTLSMNRGKITIPNNLQLTTSPYHPMRGHQLGYRPKTNSYDGWTVAVWEQYIRDLAVFGTNAVELIPPRSDDAADSPHFPLPPMEMMVEMSRLLDQYGLDVWIWYPAMDEDYSDPKTVEFALREWGDVFKKLPRIDAVFVPGGDPGKTRPKILMALLEKQTHVLHRYHPKAQMWVSPQGFSRQWMDEFCAILDSQPAWLTGIVYGPQTRLTLAQLRARVPQRYPIRHYPDITHSRQCQYPVQDWDAAFAVTEAREVINPRPLAQARIFQLTRKDTVGFIAYSEGCNDDVNKIIWSSLGWDPDASVPGILRDYSRYFIGDGYSDSFTQGLLALEKNWQGPVLTNEAIYSTLRQFQAMERAASPQDLSNWRFQQTLYRAYYDAYVRSRLLHETALQDRAMRSLQASRRLGALIALADAEKILDQPANPPAAEWRARIFELAEALFRSIRMQLSVERYQAIAVGRGANLDTLDYPLNNRIWLKRRFKEIRKLDAESERLAQIDEIVNWSNAGSGGFYDDLGNLMAQPHLIRGPGFENDPAYFASSLVFFEPLPDNPRSWWDQAIALYDAPLMMRYTGLDPGAQYKLRAVYGGGPIRLTANAGIEIHPLINWRYERLEFEIPQDATRSGELVLNWTKTPGEGGAGRGCQVAEVWLIKK